MADEESSGGSSPSFTYRDEPGIAADSTPYETSEQPAVLSSQATQISAPQKEPSEAPRRPAFLSCKWPEGSDWAVGLARELESLGVQVVHDARHHTKLHEVETLVKDSSCVIMLVTPGFYLALANKPLGNRALKEVKLALQYDKPLLAVVHASYCGQNPLPALTSLRELTSESEDGPPAWTSLELARVAAAQAVLVFKGGDGFEGYQRELVRLAHAAMDSASGGGGDEGGGGPHASGTHGEGEEKRLREVLRVAGLSKRVPSLLEGGIRSPAALDAALQKGRLSAKPYNWPEKWLKKAAQILESWPVLATMPEWLRTAPEGLAPLLVPLLAQEEAREFDREGRPRPKRGALPPIAALELAGQGPVVMGPRGGVAVAAMIRDVGGAMAEAARRREAYQQQEQAAAANGGGAVAAAPPPSLYGTSTTLLTLTLVDLRECDLGTAAASEVLAAVMTCPSIETLLLGGNGIEDGVAADFASVMRRAAAAAANTDCLAPGAGGGAGLRTLRLDHNQLTDKGAAAVVSVLYEYPGSLTSLDLSGNSCLGVATAEAVVRVLRASHARLCHIGLTGTQLDEAALSALIPVLLSPRPGVQPGTDELDLYGNAIDSEALAAMAAAARQPGYGGGPRMISLTGANLRVVPSSRRAALPEASGHTGAAAGSGGGGGSGNASSLAAALLHSYNVEELRLGWCGLSGAGLRLLVSGLMSRPGATRVAGPQPLARLTVLDLTGNKLGPEGVSLLGALLPVNLPSLRHLVLEECGFVGRELGMLAGMLDVAPWVVEALQGALRLILNDEVTGGVRGIWTEPPGEMPPERQRLRVSLGAEAEGAAAATLAGMLRTWLSMEAAAAAAEVRRLMLPTPAAAASSFASPNSFTARKAVAALTAGGPNKLTGLGCLLVHPVVQPVLEALRQTWEALRAEAAEAAADAGPDGPRRLPLMTPAAQAAFRALDAAVVHLRGCCEVMGLESLSLGRNGLAHEAGAPLGAAIALSATVRYIGLRGVVQPPAPAPVAGTGAAAAAAAAAAAQGGPMAAAAAAARDVRALLRSLYPSAAAAIDGALTSTTPPTPATPVTGPKQTGSFWMGGNSTAPSRRATQTEMPREPTSDGCLDPRAVQDSLASHAAAQQLLPLLPGVRSLDLTDAGISSHNVAHLADLVRHLPCLEQLVLDFNSLSSAAGAAAAASNGAAISSSSTTDGTGVATPPDATSGLFAELAALPRLSYLSLNYACDAGAMFAAADYLLGLASAVPSSSSSVTSTSGAPPPPPSCPHLRVLSLVGCPLDCVVARRLARALLHNTSLAVLRLGGGDPPEGVGPIGSRALGEALTAHRGLVELSLSGVGLTDNAARMIADALPQLPLLCKLDLSYNSLTGYGVESLAGALLARNRNAVGAAAENKLNMQIHGNRISDELEARMQSLSVQPNMTHAADRMPSVTRYGPPPPRTAAAGCAGGGRSRSPYLASYGAGTGAPNRAQPGSPGPVSRSTSLPPAPILVPPPTLVRAPVPRHGPAPLQVKGPRCAWSPPKNGHGTAASPTTPGGGPLGGGPLGSSKTTLLTAAPPPPPVRRGSCQSLSDDTPVGNGYDDEYGGRTAFPTSTNKLTKIYGGGGGGYYATADSGRRSSPNTNRPVSSPPPKALPMGLGYVRPSAPGAPYAQALVTAAATNPYVSMIQRNRPATSRIDTGLGGSSSDGQGSLPAVRQTWPARSGGEGGSGGGSAGGDAEGSEPPRPKVYGASEHLTQRIKCHMPDWVQRMQEDYYKKITGPLRPPASGNPPPPPVPPSEHLSRPLLCQDTDWQRHMLAEQVARETAPEPQPKPVPGAPTTAGAVSAVALMQRGGGRPVAQSNNYNNSNNAAAAASQPPGRTPRASEKGTAAAGAAAAAPASVVAEDEVAAADGVAEADVGESPFQHAGAPEESADAGADADAGAGADADADAEGPGTQAAGEGEGGAAETTAETEVEAEAASVRPAPAGAVAALLADLATSGRGASRDNLGSEESMEVLAVRNTGRRKAAIEVMRIKKAKGGEEGGADGGAEDAEGGGEEGGERGGEDPGEDGERARSEKDDVYDGEVEAAAEEYGGDGNGDGAGGEGVYPADVRVGEQREREQEEAGAGYGGEAARRGDGAVEGGASGAYDGDAGGLGGGAGPEDAYGNESPAAVTSGEAAAELRPALSKSSRSSSSSSSSSAASRGSRGSGKGRGSGRLVEVEGDDS